MAYVDARVVPARYCGGLLKRDKGFVVEVSVGASSYNPYLIFRRKGDAKALADEINNDASVADVVRGWWDSKFDDVGHELPEHVPEDAGDYAAVRGYSGYD